MRDKLPTSPLARGAVLGAIVGLVLSAIYGGGVMIALLVMAARPSPGTPAGDYAVQLAILPVTLTFAMFCIILIGLIPASLIGAALGTVISALMGPIRPYLSGPRGGGLGVLVALGFALLFHWLLPWAAAGETRFYWLYQGGPSLGCILGGGWIGWWLGNVNQTSPRQ